MQTFVYKGSIRRRKIFKTIEEARAWRDEQHMDLYGEVFK